jgi:hypothetical protein
MNRTKVLGLALLAAFALSIVASASASAAAWHVGTKELKTSSETAAVKSPATVITAAKLTAAGVTITCTGLEGVSPELVGPNVFTATSLTFTGCSVTAGECKVATSIKTVAVKGEATTGTSPDDKVVLKPASGTSFTTIEFEGAKCALAGEQAVKGQVTIDAPKGVTPAAKQKITVNDSTGLKVGVNAATITGEAELALVSGEEFSFH